jgi:hypothetical protein
MVASDKAGKKSPEVYRGPREIQKAEIFLCGDQSLRNPVLTNKGVIWQVPGSTIDLDRL